MSTKNDGLVLVHGIRAQATAASREFFITVEVILAISKYTLLENDEEGGEANLKLNRKEAFPMKCHFTRFEQYSH